MFHLTARVAWHDAKWDGTVCRQPSCNSFCVALDRIRESRDEEKEVALAGRKWSSLDPTELPPCKAESGAFMNSEEWRRRFVHPYAGLSKTTKTHGHLKPTTVKIPEYSTFVVPFAWMLRSEQEAIDARLPNPLPPDEDSPFDKSPWVFGRARQEAILKLFSGRIARDKSLVFFYWQGRPAAWRHHPSSGHGSGSASGTFGMDSSSARHCSPRARMRRPASTPFD